MNTKQIWAVIGGIFLWGIMIIGYWWHSEYLSMQKQMLRERFWSDEAQQLETRMVRIIELQSQMMEAR